jgi:Dyp-type peroxidase family
MTNASEMQALQEDVLEIDEIQGNILAGFNKDFQTFLFLKIHDRELTKIWLGSLIPYIATVAEVLSFNRMFRMLRNRRSADPQGMVATWINIAFTYEGIKALTSEAEASQFQDTPFRIGLPKRAGLLGDPTDPNAEGHPNQWVVGGTDPNQYPDILLTIASDDPAHLEVELSRIRTTIQALPSENSNEGKSALEIIYEQPGATRPDKPGHEQFGFKDGISQPAVRGRVSSTDQDFLAPRLIDPQDPRSALYAKPGQPLVWPGQFVLGYPGQRKDDPLTPQPLLPTSPSWARNGSFLVLRRLRQDVPAFWNFANEQAAKLSQQPGFAGMTPERFATLLVGRWPSGAPLMRSPNADDERLAKDGLANNHFLYVAPTQPISLVPIPDYSGDTFPQAITDFSGTVCPYFAHVRKVNPRDTGTDTGGASDTLTRMILRRGIPFGLPLKDAIKPTESELDEERGLIFVSYQTSIKDQFEFLMNHWTNIDNQPPPGAGPDPLIGQQQDPAENRTRMLKIMGTNGSIEVIKIPKDWVIPTAGGYFFAPSISALKIVLSSNQL